MTNITWHQPVWQHIYSMQKQGRLPHALLITGVAGLGKQLLAESLVGRILCQNPNAQYEACGECHSCHLLAAGHHPDYQYIAPEEGSKQIRIDQIRDLKDSQTLMPKVSKAKAILISDTGKMNMNAFNSLLKLLEEPQDNTILILLSALSQQLPITIRSRCQQINIPTPKQTEALTWLSEQDNSLTSDEWLQVLDFSQGAPLAALAMQQQGIGIAQIKQIQQSIDTVFNTDFNVMQVAGDWQEFDFKMVLMQCQNIVQQKIYQITQKSPDNISRVMSNYWEIYDCITERIKLESLQNNLNKNMLIEDFLITVSQKKQKLNSVNIG